MACLAMMCLFRSSMLSMFSISRPCLQWETAVRQHRPFQIVELLPLTAQLPLELQLELQPELEPKLEPELQPELQLERDPELQLQLEREPKLEPEPKLDLELDLELELELPVPGRQVPAGPQAVQQDNQSTHLIPTGNRSSKHSEDEDHSQK